jgi:hypothetical protein
MTGSGIGTSGGFGSMGIYGQQNWQKLARERALANRFGQSMYNQTVFGGYGDLRRSPEEQQFEAYKYASQPFSGSDIGGFRLGGIGPLDIMAAERERAKQLPSPMAASEQEMGGLPTAEDILRPENFKVKTRTTSGGITASIKPSMDWYKDIQRLAFPVMRRMAYS